MANDELEETPVPEAESEPTAEASATDDGVVADGEWENDDEDATPTTDGN